MVGFTVTSEGFRKLSGASSKLLEDFTKFSVLGKFRGFQVGFIEASLAFQRVSRVFRECFRAVSADSSGFRRFVHNTEIDYCDDYSWRVIGTEG